MNAALLPRMVVTTPAFTEGQRAGGVAMETAVREASRS